MSKRWNKAVFIRVVNSMKYVWRRYVEGTVKVWTKCGSSKNISNVVFFAYLKHTLKALQRHKEIKFRKDWTAFSDFLNKFLV